MDPALSSVYVGHGQNNLYHGILISGKAYNSPASSPAQANSTHSARGFCLWEPQLCYSRVEKEEGGVEGGVRYYPGYLIFYPTAVVIIPFPRTFLLRATEESKGTGVFHPLSSVPSGDGQAVHQSQCNHPSFPMANQITGALYLTEAATYTIGVHFCPLASPSCRKLSGVGLAGGVGGEQNEQIQLFNFQETTGALGGEHGQQHESSSSLEPTGALADKYGVQNSPSSFQGTTYRNVCIGSLLSSTSGKQISSKCRKAQKARAVPRKNDEEDQLFQDSLACKSPLGAKPIKERLGDPVTSSNMMNLDNKWSSGQDITTSIGDGSDQITSSVLSTNKGNSQVDEEIELFSAIHLAANKRKCQIVEEIEELPIEKGKSELVDEEIEVGHTGASVELGDQEYGGTKVCHLPCQIGRSLCGHPCASPSHPRDCPPCKALVMQDCHCKACVHSFSCDQYTAASEIERERMCSCGGSCRKRLLNCAHRCSDICHARPCKPNNCHKKVILRCKCQRLKKEWLCCDVQEAKLWQRSSPKQKGYQRGEYSNLIPCDEGCSLSIWMKETQNEAEIQRSAEETEAGGARMARRQWSNFMSKIVIVFLAILLILGMQIRLVN